MRKQGKGPYTLGLAYIDQEAQLVNLEICVDPNPLRSEIKKKAVLKKMKKAAEACLMLPLPAVRTPKFDPEAGVCQTRGKEGIQDLF